jgi:hypothetical protein
MATVFGLDFLVPGDLNGSFRGQPGRSENAGTPLEGMSPFITKEAGRCWTETIEATVQSDKIRFS